MFVDHIYTKAGDMTKHAIAEFGSAQAARRITSGKKSLDGNCKDVKVKPALTPTDSSRIWALRTAEELISNDPKLQGRKVEVKKTDGRGILVDGAVAFSQKDRRDPRGICENEFKHLQLP